MKEAHEAVFSAEHATLANAGSPGYQPKVRGVEAKVLTLKDLIEDPKTAHAKLNGKVEDEWKVEAAKLVEKKQDREQVEPRGKSTDS